MFTFLGGGGLINASRLFHLGGNRSLTRYGLRFGVAFAMF